MGTDQNPALLDLNGRVIKTDEVLCLSPFADIFLGQLNDVGVARVRDIGLPVRRQVAIKVVRGECDDPLSRTLTRRFNRERCVWVLLNHPNVLPCYGITYDINRRPSLISPYCREGDASKYLKKHPNADRMAIVKGIAAGLKYLHSQNVVHGDLKLRNVVIDVDNSIVTPRICDFGRSEIRDTTGFTTWSAIGTTVYMAPEFLEGCDGSQDHNPEAQKPMIKLTFEMDVYSFAMVTLEILSGKTPLFDMNRYKVGMAVMDGQRPMFYKHNCPSLTPGMRALIDQCWLHTPAQRLKMPEIVRRLGAGL